MRKDKIKKVDENGNIFTYRDLQEAAKSISSRLDDWKIQLFIADAINNKKRAFKCQWFKIEN